MLIVRFFILIPILFAIHYFMFTENIKKYLEKKLGLFFITKLYRLFYAIFTISLIIFFFKLLIQLPYIEIINWQASFSNIAFLAIATIAGLICLFLMVEALWTLGINNLLGIKQLFSNKQTTFYLDYILVPLKITGLYKRHRHPFLFYSIPFTFFVLPTFTTNNLIALIAVTVYYPIFAKMVESQLLSIHKKDFSNYVSKTKFFFPMLKKYQDEPTKK